MSGGQPGNFNFPVMISRDLIDCQEGSGRFPNCQMGKGTEMRSADDLKTVRRTAEEIPALPEGNKIEIN
jgi:hypothetical protein